MFLSLATGGIVGFDFGVAYAAPKFVLEGRMLSLQAEVKTLGINTINVNTSFFRTELLNEESTNFAKASIVDYNECGGVPIPFCKGANGEQLAGTAKLIYALIELSNEEKSPVSFLKSADVIGAAE